MRAFARRCLVIALTAVACTSSTSPSGANVAGNWSGTLTSSYAGSGTVGFSLSQSGSSVSGTWFTTFGNSANNNSGSLSGNLNGSTITAVLTPSNPLGCPSNVTGTLNGSTSITGTYAAFSCSVSDGGPFTVTKH
jgi:hypothetical protein